MEGTPGFCKDDIALSAVHVDVWDGHVFANLSAAPAPLKDQIGDAGREVQCRGACTSCGARTA